MMKAKEKDDGLTKFQRYRQQKRRAGMRQLRIWVPDPRQAGFAEEARRQGHLLHDRIEEGEALEFIDAAFPWPSV